MKIATCPENKEVKSAGYRGLLRHRFSLPAYDSVFTGYFIFATCFAILKTLHRFKKFMQRLRQVSLIAILLTSFVGLVRGYRMARYGDRSGILFAYEEDKIRATIFANYQLFGMIFFFLIGAFSLIVFFTILVQKKYFAYLMLAEGIFATFFSLTHIVYNGFLWVHFMTLPASFSIIVLAILQTPNEF